MKRITLLIALFLTVLNIKAVNDSIVFSGNDIPEKYIGSDIKFAQTLHVCGRGYNRLYLSYARQRLPYEAEIEGTPAYATAEEDFEYAFITAYCPYISVDTIRLGATLTNAVATVTGSRDITLKANTHFGNNARPSTRPYVGDARLIVCAANAENYFPNWSGTNGASSNEEYQRQHTKLLKALRNIDADIFCLAEIQTGQIALTALTHALNAQTAPNRYAYVDDGDTESDIYSKVGFIYRTDKVSPVLPVGHPYNSSSVYYKREYLQAFDEIATGERFILCMNHFKAKSGDDDNSNEVRMANVGKLIDFITIKMNSNYYQDQDFLILGDLNCGTMEEPIRFLSTMGFENQLARFSSDEYSYTYNYGVEYLDHAFATSSMAEQITGAAPYHLNADESSAFYYYNGTDQSMYRYADHDPIIVGLKPGNTNNISAAVTDDDFRVFARSGAIVVESTTTAPLTICDMLGRYVYNGSCTNGTTVNVKAGIYIVRFGDKIGKIAVGM